MQSDEQLVQAVLAGERAAYALLVQRYERSVYAAALAVLGNRETARDAAQDAFVLAYEKLNSLRKPAAYGAWLLMITRRKAVELSRNRMRLVPLNVAANLPDQGREETPSDETLRNLLQALDHLPDHEQRVLNLRYFDSHPIATIAEITGRSVGTVTKQISRALERLRERLKEKNP